MRGSSAFAVAALALALAAGCAGSAPKAGNGGADTGSDGGADAQVIDATDDVAADAIADHSSASDSPQSVCNPTAPFGAPVPLAGINTPGAKEGGPRLTADELTLYFSKAVTGSVSSLFVAHRSSTTTAFDPATPLTALDSAFDEYDPTTFNELTIYFTAVDRPGANDLWTATRASAADPFGPPTALPGPLNSGSSDAQPFLRADGAELWFASNRPGDAGVVGNYGIYRATKSGTSFAAPALVAELSTPGADSFTPTVSADGLVVLFSSTRGDGGALGSEDIWIASRGTAADPFSNVTNVSALNSSSADFPGWLSADGCRLYMSSTRSGNEEIYLATRGP